jgi:uncharacterized membrane protein
MRIDAVRHRGFYISLGLGVVAGLLTLPFAAGMALAVGVNVFFAAYLAVAAIEGRRLTAQFLRQHADEEDAPAPVILLVMAGAVAVSAVSLFMVLMGDKGNMPLPLGLGVAAVVLGWFAIHTMSAMHYAFEYYKAPAGHAGNGRKREIAGGLDFRGGEEPDGTSFIYFSYVIGMTAQTSDTGVTSNAMRRIVTMHAIFSFFFNTVIVAAAVNIVVSLANGG